MAMRTLSIEELLEVEKDLEDLDADMWGMTLMTITHDFADIMFALGSGSSAGMYKYFRFFYSSMCQALNIGMQVLLLVKTNTYVVNPAVHDIQEDYVAFHADVFDPDGTFRRDLWHVWTGPWMDLCNSAMTKLTFTQAVMVLWTTRMLGEFRAAWRLWRRVMRVPPMPAGVSASDMVTTVTGDGGDVSHILYLNCGTRFMLLLFCVMPKAIVGIALWLIGCRWLNATESFDDLIMNALALEFIIGIDEIILKNFFPDRIHKDIAATKFAFPKSKDEQAAVDAQKVRVYVRSLAFAVLVFGWCFMYLEFWQQVLPGFDRDIGRHCKGDLFTGKFELICKPFEVGCFPYGPADGERLPEVPLEDGDAGERLLQASNSAGVTVASLLAEIALLP